MRSGERSSSFSRRRLTSSAASSRSGSRPASFFIEVPTRPRRLDATKLPPPEVSWAASPQVALGYLLFGLVCLVFSVLPGAKTPVTHPDEADIVAGH